MSIDRPSASDQVPLLPHAAGGLGRVFGNLAHLLGGKAAAGLISLVYLVIATRSLGVGGYGVLVLVNAYVVLVGSVVAFSGYHGVVRFGALELAAGRPGGLARLIRFAALIELGFGLAAMLAAAALVPVVGPRLGWPPAAMQLALPYSLAVAATVRATPQGLLQLARRFDLLGLHQAISPLVRLAGATIAWVTGAGLSGFIAAWLVAAIVEGLSMWALAWLGWRRLMPGEPIFGRWRGAVTDHPALVRFSITTNIDLTLRELAPNLAPLTVGWLLGPAAAGLFALAQRASAILQQPALILSQASYAVFADLAAARDFAALARTVWRSASIAVAAATPIALALALYGGWVLTKLGGPSFAGGTTLLTLVALSRMAALAAAPLGAGLTGLGLPQRSLTVALASNLGLYPLLPLLLWRMGVDGAGWHALLQTSVMLIWLALAFRRDAAIAR